MAADFSARLNEWGRAAFAQEVQTDFIRARIFDNFFAQIEFDALREFSKEDLQVLGNILPGLDDESRTKLTGREEHLVSALIVARKRLVMSRREEIIGESLRRHESVREQMMKIRKLAQGIFKELAKRWDCELRKEESLVWIFSRLERWGEISMPFELREKTEFSYYISIEDNDYKRVLTRDSYLPRLGLNARSGCCFTSPETFEEKLWKAAEIIEWQLNDYIRIIESLNWPRLEPIT